MSVVEVADDMIDAVRAPVRQRQQEDECEHSAHNATRSVAPGQVVLEVANAHAIVTLHVVAIATLADCVVAYQVRVVALPTFGVRGADLAHAEADVRPPQQRLRLGQSVRRLLRPLLVVGGVVLVLAQISSRDEHKVWPASTFAQVAVSVAARAVVPRDARVVRLEVRGRIGELGQHQQCASGHRVGGGVAGAATARRIDLQRQCG